MSSPMNSAMTAHALVVTHRLDRAALIPHAPYIAYTERHHVALPQPLNFSFIGHADVTGTQAEAVILLLENGIPNDEQFALSNELLSRGKRVYYYWPAESAIEVIDDERYGSMRLHRWAMRFGNWLNARREKRLARMGNAGSPHYADTLSVRATAELMGRETESLDGHLKGGVAELRRGLGATADQFAAHTDAVAAQLRAAAAAAGGNDQAVSAIAAAQAALEGVTATIGSLRQFGEGISAHIEGGFPVIERLKSQAATAASDVMRIDLTKKS